MFFFFLFVTRPTRCPSETDPRTPPLCSFIPFLASLVLTKPAHTAGCPPFIPLGQSFEFSEVCASRQEGRFPDEESSHMGLEVFFRLPWNPSRRLKLRSFFRSPFCLPIDLFPPILNILVFFAPAPSQEAPNCGKVLLIPRAPWHICPFLHSKVWGSFLLFFPLSSSPERQLGCPLPFQTFLRAPPLSTLSLKIHPPPPHSLDTWVKLLYSLFPCISFFTQFYRFTPLSLGPFLSSMFLWRTLPFRKSVFACLNILSWTFPPPTPLSCTPLQKTFGASFCAAL